VARASLWPNNTFGASRSTIVAKRVQAILHCAHRATSVDLIDPSKLACFPPPGRVSMLVYVRPSNEAINAPSKLARYLFGDGG
jgi:hypothetical protein